MALRVSKALSRLHANVYWDERKKDVANFVAQCKICQQIKCIARAPVGFLQPIEPPTQALEDLPMDFVVHLLAYSNNNVVMVTIGRFKAVHFRMLPTYFTFQGG